MRAEEGWPRSSQHRGLAYPNHDATIGNGEAPQALIQRDINAMSCT